MATEQNGPFGDGFAETSPYIDFTGWAGGFWHTDTNFDHFGAREYAKTQGRWLTPDPAGLAAVDITNPQSWNRYAYVLNNPVSYVDPTGLDCIYDNGDGTGRLQAGDCDSATDDGYYVPGTYTSGTYDPNTGELTSISYNPTDPSDTGFVAFADSVAQSSGAAVNAFGMPFSNGMLGGGTAANNGTPNPTFFFPPKTCSGTARVLGGNPATVGQQGGVPGTLVAPGSAAAIPRQFGFRTGSGFSGQPISGTVGYTGPLAFPGMSQSFSGVTDTIGSSTVPNVQNFLMKNNPGALILELVTGSDMGRVPVQIQVPASMSCPAGTS